MEDKMYDPWFDTEGEMLQIGQQYTRKEYARTLQLLADGASIYEGELAKGIVEAVQGRGGLMSLDDLKCGYELNRADVVYTVEWNEPLSAEFRGHSLWTVPAPASGAIWLNAMGVLGEFGVEGSGSVIDLHRMTESLRVSWACTKLTAACVRNAIAVR
jgi:gamma-glutamyltranspeptidase/glutathione hydrolase